MPTCCESKFNRESLVYIFSMPLGQIASLLLKVLSIATINTLGPVVQSLVSLTSLLVVKSLTVLVSKISNSQVFCCKNVSSFCNAKATHIFFSKNISVYEKVLSLCSDYFSATFYQTYFYYKPSKYFPFTETHFCNLSTQSRKADKQSSFGICWRH